MKQDRFATRCGCTVAAVVRGDTDRNDPPTETCRHGHIHTIYVAEHHDLAVDSDGATYQDVIWEPVPDD